MNNLSGLLDQMEKLPINELEKLLEYINTRPHKLENRRPTVEEQRAMIARIKATIARAHIESDEEERNNIINAALRDMDRFT